MNIQPGRIGVAGYFVITANIHVPIEICVPGALQLVLFTYLADSQPRTSRLKVHQNGGGGEGVYDRCRSESVGQCVTDIVGGFRVQVSTAEDRVGIAGEPYSGLGICRIRGFLVSDVGRDDVLAATG